VDEERNPYCPGAGWPPPELVGREEVVRNFDLLLKRLARGRHHRSQIVTGLRGVGKTVLLRHFEGLARSADWYVALHEVQEGEDFRRAMAEIARTLILEMGSHPKLRGLAHRALGVLRSFALKPSVKTSPDGSVEWALGIEPVPGQGDSGNLSTDLGVLFVEMGRLAKRRDSGVILLFDEVQGLNKKDLTALIVAFHRAHQDQLPIAIVAAGLPQLPKLAAQAKSYAERLFEFPELGALEDAAGRAAVEGPAKLEGARYEPEALDVIKGESEWFPYFIQVWGSVAWNTAPGPAVITAADVEKARPAALKNLDSNFFKVRDEKATEKERDFMRAMTSLGDGPYKPGDIQRVMGVADQRSLSFVRDNLIKKGLVYSPGWGQIAFTVPHFAAYLRRKYPAWKDRDPLSVAGRASGGPAVRRETARAGESTREEIAPSPRSRSRMIGQGPTKG